MPKANDAGGTVKGGWMREDEWEIGDVLLLSLTKVANTLDRLRVCLHPALSQAAGY
jgi:hypothetical protein